MIAVCVLTIAFMLTTAILGAWCARLVRERNQARATAQYWWSAVCRAQHDAGARVRRAIQSSQDRRGAPGGWQP